MNKKKIVQLIDNSIRGGAEKSTYLITREFIKKGYLVYLVFPPGDYASEFHRLEKEGAITIELPLRKNMLFAFWSIRSLLLQEQIHYIHSHQIRADLIASLTKLSLPGYLVKIGSSVHCLIKNDLTPSLKKGIYYLSSFVTYRLMDAIFTVSAAMKNELASYYLISPQKITVTLNSISFSEITTNSINQKAIKKEYGIGGNDILIVCAGELSKRKGQLLLIEAFHFLQPSERIKLVLLGNGPLKEKLREKINSLNLKNNVVMPGYRKDIYDWIALSTIYIQPSVYDPLPRALLEAMYLKKPVIASDIDTIKDVVINNHTGLLTSLNPIIICKKIQELIIDNQKRAYLGRHAHNFILYNCSMEKMCTAIEYSLIFNPK